MHLSKSTSENDTWILKAVVDDLVTRDDRKKSQDGIPWHINNSIRAKGRAEKQADA